MKRKISMFMTVLMTTAMVMPTVAFGSSSPVMYGDYSCNDQQRTGTYHWAVSGQEDNLTLTVTGGSGVFEGRLVNSSTGDTSPYDICRMKTIDLHSCNNDDIRIGDWWTTEEEDEGTPFQAETIKLPSGMTSFSDDNDLLGKLKNITVEDGCANYSVNNSVLFGPKRTWDQQGHEQVDNSKKTLILYPASKEGTAYSVDSDTKAIGGDAFNGARNLRTVNIPASVEDMNECWYQDVGNTNEWYEGGTGAFAGCRALEAINVDASNANYSSDSGILFNRDKRTLYLYPYAKDAEAHLYTVPATTTKLFKNCFANEEKITGVVIGKNVTDFHAGIFGETGDRTSITDVYYEGSEAEWNSKWNNIGPDNKGVEDYYLPRMHYNSTGPEKKNEAADPASAVHEKVGADEKPTAESAKYVFNQDTMKTLVANTKKVDISEKLKKAAVSGNAYDDDKKTKHRYKLSDKKIASIDKKGTITPKKRGEIDVWVEQKKKGEKTWQQVGEKVHLYIQMPEMKKKHELTDAAEGNTLNAYDFLSGTTYSPTKWESSNTKIATVDEKGIITVKKKGSVKIIAVYGEGKNSSKKKYKTNLKIKFPKTAKK